MLKGENIYLRLIEPDDFEYTYKWRNDDVVLNMTCGIIRPISKEMEKEWTKRKSMSNTEELYLAICLNSNDQMIGWYSINDIDYRNRKCFCGGIVIGEKEYRDGFAYQEASNLVFDYIINELYMNRVTGACLREHIMSRAQMEAKYWTLEGIERQAIYKNGTYHDICHYAILRDEYLSHLQNGDYEPASIIRRVAKRVKELRIEMKSINANK